MGNSKIKCLLFPIIFCAFSLTSFSQAHQFKVALDAGHGAHDPGSAYNGHIEKSIALGVVLKVGKILEDTPGFQVIYTRKTDIFVDLVTEFCRDSRGRIEAREGDEMHVES